MLPEWLTDPAQGVPLDDLAREMLGVALARVQEVCVVCVCVCVRVCVLVEVSMMACMCMPSMMVCHCANFECEPSDYVPVWWTM